MPHPEHIKTTETTGHLNQDLHNDNRLYLRSEEVQEILGRPPRRIVRWGGGVNINFQKNGNVLIFCLILHSKIFRMFEARSTKHEARSTKHEARSTKHEARSTKHEARSTKHEARNYCCALWDSLHRVEFVQS